MDLACYSAWKEIRCWLLWSFQSPVWYLKYQNQMFVLLSWNKALSGGETMIYTFLSTEEMLHLAQENCYGKRLTVLTDGNRARCDLACHEGISLFSFEWHFLSCEAWKLKRRTENSSRGLVIKKLDCDGICNDKTACVVLVYNHCSINRVVQVYFSTWK